MTAWVCNDTHLPRATGTPEHVVMALLIALPLRLFVCKRRAWV
jgi:hypothetical protein